MSSQLRVDNILPSAGTALGIGTASGSITFNSSNISGDVIFNDNVTVNGLLTYEDVTNIDAVGVITARSDVSIADKIIHTGDTNTAIRFPAADTITAETGGSERLRITSDGNLVMNGGSPNHDASSGSIFLIPPSGNPNRGIKWSDTSDTHYVKLEPSVIDGLTINGYSGVAFATGSRTNSTWAERLRITSAGIVDVTGKLRIDISNGGTAGSGTAEGIFLRNTQETDNNAVTIFGGADDYNAAASAINFINVDHSANAGDISFDTRSTSNSYAERLRITSGGSIGTKGLIPTDGSFVANSTIRSQNSSSNISYIGFTGYTGNTTVGSMFSYMGGDGRNTGYLTFNTNDTERLRITSDGYQYHYNNGSLRMCLNATGLGVNTSTITGGRLIHAHNTGTGSAYFQSTNSNTGEGASAGALFGVSGTTCYAPWNYINGPVVFATNSSEKMRIHATGEVTKSSQPLAIIGTTQNNWSPSAGDVLPFNYTNTNRGNHYNTSNYTFTCPVAGDYMVILRLSRKGFRGDVELAKNNSQYALLELRETGRNDSNAADWQAWCYDFIVPCAANDTLKWKAPNVYTGTGGGNYLLDGLNHIYYDSVTYYLMG